MEYFKEFVNFTIYSPEYHQKIEKNQEKSIDLPFSSDLSPVEMQWDVERDTQYNSGDLDC